MAQVYAVISAVGADRVGIVDDLSGIVAEAGGNIEESKMAVLGGEFAVIMLVSMEARALESLVSKSAGIETALGLKFGVKPTKPGTPLGKGRPYSLETVSLDGKGIVHSVSAVLRKHGINIEDLETSTDSAPLTGASLFRMTANIVLGPDVSVLALRHELEQLQVDQDLDISLTPLVSARLD
jgi:glycine cleavage system transcriptional repressor